MSNISGFWISVLVIAAVWELYWKAAQRKQTAWFIALLLINSAGILPLLYLYLNGDSDANN